VVFEDGEELTAEPVEEVQNAPPPSMAIEAETGSEPVSIPGPPQIIEIEEPKNVEVDPPDEPLIEIPIQDIVPKNDTRRDVIIETGDFPINTHTGKTASPVDFARIATAETLHAAAEKQPTTGLPALPIIAASALVALYARRKVN